MDPELARLLADLRDHADLFDLESGLGADALDIAINGVKDHFDHQVDPEGAPWKELSDRYRRDKARLYPGKPIGEREGLMRSEIDGERAIEPDSAEWTYGSGDEARQEATWFQEGDPDQNRPARRFADLNAESISKSDQLFDRHFDEGTSA